MGRNAMHYAAVANQAGAIDTLQQWANSVPQVQRGAPDAGAR
jgi:hypothetical protein